jgi:hypothetical protein
MVALCLRAIFDTDEQRRQRDPTRATVQVPVHRSPAPTPCVGSLSAGNGATSTQMILSKQFRWTRALLERCRQIAVT